jgi:UDP-glucuronate 4-epimerase
MKILVTGAAGFIGMHVTKHLLIRGNTVIGIDNLNDYYDPALKNARLNELSSYQNFRFKLLDIADRSSIPMLFADEKFDCVVHLAAQAGVRYSLDNPNAYVDSNLVGFVNILEGCRHTKVKHLVYASSSSVYGGNRKIPFSERDPVDQPVSLYAATKKANELLAHSYSHLYGLPTTGLRFFTVYGPWGRPDMSPWLFTSAIFENRSIDVFNYGKMQRDFTYIDDIVDGTIRALDCPPKKNSTENNINISNINNPPYNIYNIGGSEPVALLDFINCIEMSLCKTATKKMLPMQPGDVVSTYADISKLTQETGYNPKVNITNGIEKWVDWYKKYNGL